MVPPPPSALRRKERWVIGNRSDTNKTPSSRGRMVNCLRSTPMQNMSTPLACACAAVAAAAAMTIRSFLACIGALFSVLEAHYYPGPTIASLFLSLSLIRMYICTIKTEKLSHASVTSVAPLPPQPPCLSSPVPSSTLLISVYASLISSPLPLSLKKKKKDCIGGSTESRSPGAYSPSDWESSSTLPSFGGDLVHIPTLFSLLAARSRSRERRRRRR